MHKDITKHLQELSEQCFVISERLARINHELQSQTDESAPIEISEIYDDNIQHMVDIKNIPVAK